MKIKLLVGDSSGDGHNKAEYVTFEVNKNNIEITNAYLEFVKTNKISLHFNYGKGPKKTLKVILADYKESSVDDDIAEKLKALGVDLSAIESLKYLNFEEVAKLFLEMARVYLKDLVYELEESDGIPVLNQSKLLNCSIGYGVFT